MKVNKELKNYENSLPKSIRINRLYGFDPYGFFEITIKTWDNITYKGIIDDSEVVKLLKKYTPYEKYKKFKIE